MDLWSLVQQFLGDEALKAMVPGRILAVDDDEGNLVVLEEFLADDYEVDSTTSPRQALEMVRDGRYDMVISDQRMPGMTGVELLHQVRVQQPHMVRVIISAYSDARAMLEAINVGEVFRFVLKPWDPDQVETVVKQGLEFRLQQLVIRRLVEELHGKNVDLQKTLNELQQTQDRLLRSARLATVGQLTTSIVRELKNHVTGVQVLAEAIRDAQVPAELSEYVELGLNSAQSLFELVSGINAFARKDQWKLKRNRTSLNRVLETALGIVRLDRRASHRRIEFALAEGLPDAIIDGEKMRQVAVNLMLNALDATPEEGGVIKVSSGEAEDNGVQFMVNDNGPGIAPELLEHVVDPFVTTREGGLGLGLQVCRQVVESHGGRLHLVSPPGQGTTATVWLPREPTAGIAQ